MSGRSVNLTTLFLGRLRPPKRLTSTSCNTFASNWQLPFLNKWKEKRKNVARPGIEPRTPDLRVRSPTDYATRPGTIERMPSHRKVIVIFNFIDYNLIQQEYKHHRKRMLYFNISSFHGRFLIHVSSHIHIHVSVYNTTGPSCSKHR